MPSEDLFALYQSAVQNTSRVIMETEQLADDLAEAQGYTLAVNQEDGCLYLNDGGDT